MTRLKPEIFPLSLMITSHITISSDIRSFDITQSSRKSRDEVDSAWGKGFLGGGETVRQVCLNDQRFNINMVIYNTSLIRVMVLNIIRDSTSSRTCH